MQGVDVVSVANFGQVSIPKPVKNRVFERSSASLHGSDKHHRYKESGDYFVGSYDHGSRVNGTMLYANPTSQSDKAVLYHGHWKNNRWHGNGFFLTELQSVTAGIFDQGRCVRGIRYLVDGTVMDVETRTNPLLLDWTQLIKDSDGVSTCFERGVRQNEVPYGQKIEENAFFAFNSDLFPDNDVFQSLTVLDQKIEDSKDNEAIFQQVDALTEQKLAVTWFQLHCGHLAFGQSSTVFSSWSENSDMAAAEEFLRHETILRLMQGFYNMIPDDKQTALFDVKVELTVDCRPSPTNQDQYLSPVKSRAVRPLENTPTMVQSDDNVSSVAPPQATVFIDTFDAAPIKSDFVGCIAVKNTMKGGDFSIVRPQEKSRRTSYRALPEENRLCSMPCDPGSGFFVRKTADQSLGYSFSNTFFSDTAEVPLRAMLWFFFDCRS